MTPDLIEKHRGGRPDVQRIDPTLHRHGDLFVARVPYRERQALPFTAQDNATIARQRRRRQQPLVSVRMRRHTARTPAPEFTERARQGYRLDDGHAKDVTHGSPDRAAEIRVGARLPDQKRVGPEGCGVPHQATQVLGIGEGIHGDEEARAPRIPQAISNSTGAGIRAQASRPWYIENPVNCSSSCFSPRYTSIDSLRASKSGRR